VHDGVQLGRGQLAEGSVVPRELHAL
jgi:hypothetical protein